jgi:hypothetical protein
VEELEFRVYEVQQVYLDLQAVRLGFKVQQVYLEFLD